MCPVTADRQTMLLCLLEPWGAQPLLCPLEQGHDRVYTGLGAGFCTRSLEKGSCWIRRAAVSSPVLPLS